jgi:uncharacterized membrane protein (UPF0136 family)
MANADPLAALLVDENDVAREELASGLAPFVQITKQGGLLPLEPFEGLNSANKVLTLLLAIKAMRMLELRDNERVGPAELTEMSGMAAGTVRPKLSALASNRLIAKDGPEYWITTLGARKALQVLVSAND